jgi:transcription antitermination protein NusB
MATTAARKVRTTALQALYEADVAHHPIDECLRRQLDDWVDDAAGAELVAQLVNGVSDNLSDIDKTIAEAAPKRPLDQMAPVDRNILRLAAYELLYRGERASTAISEAVELAKTYGSESSGRFVNGVLASISLSSTR